MKCTLCSNVIDELKTFSGTDEATQRVHADALSAWRQIEVTVRDAGGLLSLFTGHACPDHLLEPGTVQLTGTGIVVPSVPAPAPLVPVSTDPAATGTTTPSTATLPAPDDVKVRSK